MKAKTSIVLLWVLIGIVTVFVSCGSGDDDAAATGPVSVTWWVPNWDEAAARELATAFEAEHEAITIEFVITTWDSMENQIRAGLMSSSPPQLITELESRIRAYARSGLLTALNDYYADGIGSDDFIRSALEINSYNGQMYGLPFRHDGSGVIYNRTLFAEAGYDSFPATWDEAMVVSEALTVDRDGDGSIDQYAIAWPLGNQANAVTRYLQQLFTFGGDILNDDLTASALDSPAGVQAMDAIAGTILTRKIAPRSTMELDNTLLRDLFINENIAWYIGGQFDIDPIREENPDIEIGTAVIPGVDGMGYTTVNGFSLIIPAGTDHKDQAWEFAEFIARPENMATLTATFPGRKSALNHPKFDDPLLGPFSEQLARGKSEPDFPQWSEMEKIIYHYLQAVILNGMDSSQALASIDAEINTLLDN